MSLHTLGVVLVMSFVLPVGSRVAHVQAKPDFSGTWTLVEYRRGENVTTPKSSVVGGAALNCGQQCTITQTAESLTVSRSASAAGAKPIDEVVFLDGRAMSNQKTATWDGATLRLSQSFGGIVVAQTLALEQGKLVFVSTVAAGKSEPYRLTYERSSATAASRLRRSRLPARARTGRTARPR